VKVEKSGNEAAKNGTFLGLLFVAIIQWIALNYNSLVTEQKEI
jgi:hypothetical protein